MIADKTSSSSSNAQYAGHAAIMIYKEWNSNWDNDYLSKISVSAWGKGGPSWKDKEDDKVQKEPLGYWIGKEHGCPAEVTIVQMRRKRWVWNWLKSGIRFYNASTDDTTEAVNNAIGWIGRDYGYASLILGISGSVIIDPTLYTTAMCFKNSEKQFYCSQLVWRSWYKVSSEFDINPIKPVILPEDLLPYNSGGVTKYVGSYKNK